MKKITAKIRFTAAVLIAVMLMTLMPLGALADSYSAVVTEKTVKVYSDPALSSHAGSLKRGAVVVVEDVNGNVAMISYKGESGYYCDLRALTDVLEVGMPVIVNTDSLAYEKPDTASASISIKRGTELTLLAVDDKWALVEGNGYGVYMKKNCLSLVDDELSTATPAPTANPDISGSIDCTVTADTLNVYEATNTSSKKLIVLESGDKVQVIAYNSNWAYLYYEGVYGYCATSGLIKTSLMPSATPDNTPGEEIFEAVVVKDVQAYSKASTSSSKLAKLPAGTVVNVLAYNSTWAKIEKNGAVGYVKTSALTRRTEDNTPPAGNDLTDVSDFTAIALAKTPVYAEMSTASANIATLSAGETINVLAYNSEWAKIKYNGNVCYVKTPALIKYTLKNCTSYKAVVSTRVQAYAAPSDSAAKMAVLPANTEVTVTAVNSEWAKVEKGGAIGYVKLSAVSKKPAANLAEEYRGKYPNVQFTATVIAPSVPGYYDADTSSSDFTLAIGTQVDVYGYSKNWAYIGIGESRGFVATKYLSSANYTELSSGSNGENTRKLQQHLLKLGYYDGTIDGNYSSLTTTAVRRFQAANGLTQTGNADVHTLRVLYGGYAPASSLLNASFGNGSSGDNVTRLQTRLYYLDYFSKAGSIDGSYGSSTVAAIKLFQGASGLPVTGTADAATIKALYAADAKKIPAGNVAVDYTPGANDSVLKMPKGLESTQSYLPENATRSERIEFVIYHAQQQLGKPYIYGTAGPNSFDCSGFTTYCFKKVGVSLGRSAYAQGYNSSSGTKITNVSDLRRGDIVCFETISDSDSSDHVGIYLGSGYFIHASSGDTNGRRVVVNTMSSGFYQREFTWGRRPIE